MYPKSQASGLSAQLCDLDLEEAEITMDGAVVTLACRDVQI